MFQLEWTSYMWQHQIKILEKIVDWGKKFNENISAEQKIQRSRSDSDSIGLEKCVWAGGHWDRICRGSKGHKNQFRVYVMGLPTADPTWAAQIQLFVNPKLLRCKPFLQRRQGGAVYVYNVYAGGRGVERGRVFIKADIFHDQVFHKIGRTRFTKNIFLNTFFPKIWVGQVRL